MIVLNDKGGAAVRVDGHDAELVLHPEGVSVDECWEEEGRIRTREHHWFGDDASGLLLRVDPDTTSEALQALGFGSVDRGPA